MTTASLRTHLPGAWRLESYTSLPTPSSQIQRPTYPMTKNVTGLILYTADGYMSAQMQIPGQKEFLPAQDAHWVEAGKRYFAYSGPYFISEEGSGRGEVLRHKFEVCLVPDRVGEIELRSWRFEEDGRVLVLGGEESVVIKGDRRIPVLRWRRAEENAHGKPPGAVPEVTVS